MGAQDLEIALRNARRRVRVRTYRDYQELSARAVFKGDHEARRMVDALNRDPDFFPSRLPANERAARELEANPAVKALVDQGEELWRAAVTLKRIREEEPPA